MRFLASQTLGVNLMFGLVAMVLLVKSADEAVKRFIGLADYFRLSTTFVGMTVMSLATSIPEISAHLTASGGILAGTLDYQKSSAIVLGANIGSDVVQQTLILGMVVFAAGTLYFRRQFLFKNLAPMIGTTVMCIILGLDQTYSRLDGLILFGTFVGYTYYLYWDERRTIPEAGDVLEDLNGQKENVPATGRQALKFLAVAVIAMSVTVLSASIVLGSTEYLVDRTGVGGSIIGVVTLGIASALPELMTAICGIRNREHGISLGTLIGSNITNPLVAIGGGALLSTYWVPRPLIMWDLPWETVTGMLLWGILWFGKGRLGRKGSIYLMCLYAFYLVSRAAWFSSDLYV
jgi:cation:H+ antiporter